ncbi:MAG: sialate O-acetylesterase [bacterium]
MRHIFSILAALLLAPLVSLYAAELKLASVFTDHMVLQREQPVPIWGWADAGEKVTVEFGNQTKTAIADATGKWLAKLDAMSASAAPRKLKISRSLNAEPLILSDILVGDVWLCSGQSNMGMDVAGSLNSEQEIASANYPSIRLFAVKHNPALAPTNAVTGEWVQCSTQTVGRFSAAAYFFGRELHKELKIPIGLLHSSVGGTPAEAWTRLEALQTMPALAERANKEIAQINAQEGDNKRFGTDRAAWEKKYSVEPPPVAEAARNWADPALDTGDWKPITLPNQWAQLGAKSGGVFWLRRDITLPESAAGKPFGLSLNWVSEQYDTAFFNGVEVGHASDKAPDFYNLQRRYNVSGKLVKAGRNVIAVRIVSATERAGMWQWGHMLGVPVVNRTALDNQWLMKTESTFAPLPPEALKSRPKPNNIAFRSVSSALYNGMIAPLIPFGIKGAIWYQGESNAGRAGEYRELLSLMIRDWRAQWGMGEFPFMIQQLVNNGPASDDANARSSWSLLREAQVQVSDTLPNCGIAVGIELGSAFTIHPPNKQDVGKRLALVALEKTYGQKIESSGPRYSSMKIEGNSIRITFTHAKGLNAKGGTLKRFAISGSDPASPAGSAVAGPASPAGSAVTSKKFVWADAKIEGETIVVSSPYVPQPVAVRYAWLDNPDGCNLYNAAGLSAAPFRTDDWQ